MENTQADNIVEFPGAATDTPTQSEPQVAAPGSAGVCYVAGPMTGYPEYNFAAFLAAGAILEQDGWEVLNPAKHDLECGFDPRSGIAPTKEQLDEFRKWDMAAVERADKVFVLSGWMSSVGAVAEVAYAQWRGIPVQQIAVGKDPDSGGVAFGLGPFAPLIAEITKHVESAGANL